ncbi:MAG TPA: chemotaxis protein CheX [Candidatus Solibacter sp.]|nr:chemotaxis protein CheX [Candidatus Solibacter sp.]
MAAPVPKLVEPTQVLPQAQWSGILIETALEVFSIMVGVSVQVTNGSASPMAVTAVVGLGGAIRANFILQCSSPCATQIAAQMMGIPPDSPDSQQAACDALGEVSNIIAGYFKAKVGLGEACMLSVPTIITGRDYQFRSPRTYDRLEQHLLYDKERLVATLEIAK